MRGSFGRNIAKRQQANKKLDPGSIYILSQLTIHSHYHANVNNYCNLDAAVAYKAFILYFSYHNSTMGQSWLQCTTFEEIGYKNIEFDMQFIRV